MLKPFVYEASFHLGLFDKLVQDKKIGVYHMINIYNKFSDLMPIGSRHYRELSVNKDQLLAN